MRVSALALVAVGLVGCATQSPNVFPKWRNDLVAVKFIDPENAHGYPFANGIYSIDATVFQGHLRATSVLLDPGDHTIGINCAPFLPVGEVPVTSFSLAPGYDYELYCDGPEAKIRQVPAKVRKGV